MISGTRSCVMLFTISRDQTIVYPLLKTQAYHVVHKFQSVVDHIDDN